MRVYFVLSLRRIQLLFLSLSKGFKIQVQRCLVVFLKKIFFSNPSCGAILSKIVAILAVINVQELLFALK